MLLPFYNDTFGKNPVLKGRGIIGTALVNVYAPIQKINWDIIFGMGYLLDITSSAVADAFASTGTTKLVIYGLDEDWNPLTEEVTMAGQTKVTTLKKFRRVFAAYSSATGIGSVNAGDIYILKTGTGGTYTAGVPGTLTSACIKMLVGDNLGYSGLWTVPRGQNYRATAFTPSANKAGSLQIVKGYPAENTGRGPFAIFKIDVGVGSGVKNINPVIYLEEKTDIYVQGIALAATTTVSFLINLERI